MMRMPDKDENLIGKVCVCSIGRVAIVVGRKAFKFPDQQAEVMCWTGLGLDGKGTWASTNPCVLAETGEEFHDKLLKRFGGKTGHNG